MSSSMKFFYGNICFKIRILPYERKGGLISFINYTKYSKNALITHE